MSAIKDRVDTAVPEVSQRSTQLAAVNGYSAKLDSTEPAAHEAVKEAILQHLADGTPIPDDIAEPILIAQRRDELARMRNRAISDVKNFLVEEARSGRSRSADDIFAALRPELARVVTEVRELAPVLRGARNTEDLIALDADALQAWQRLEALADEYEEIRAEQDNAFVIKKSDGPRGDLKRLRDTGYFADAVDVVPFWQNERALAADASSIRKGDHYDWLQAGRIREDGASIARPPSDATIQAWRTKSIPHGTRAGRVTFLIWACTQAQPWIPTLDQYVEATSAARTASTPGSENMIDHPGKQLAALAEYYRVTGAAPPAGTPIVNVKPVSRAGGSLAVSRVRRRDPSLHDEPFARTAGGGQLRTADNAGIGSPY